MKNLTTLFLITACCVSVAAQVTNTVAVPVPTSDKFTALLAKLTDIGMGITGTLTLLLAWYSKNKETLKTINAVLIKAIESHGSPTLKTEIKDQAGSAGVEPTLATLVEKHAPSPVKPEDPFKTPTVTVPSFQTTETKTEPK